jgi:uncharacterized protein with gpF-like domain
MPNGSLPIDLAKLELKPLPLGEALEYWRDKVAMTPEEFYALAAEARAKAFTVTGIARMDMIEDVKAALDTALEQGITLRDFKKMIGDVIEAAGWPGYRVATIFNTNVQGAYNNGRYAQQIDPDVLEHRPWWQFLHTPGQANPRLDHMAHDGEVRRADDPWWDVWYPHKGSLGDWWNCKCSARTLSDDELSEFGLTPLGMDGEPRDVAALGEERWEPDMSKYPEDLRRKFEEERAHRAM